MGGEISDPLPLARELQKIGEPLYFAQPPTGYSDKSEAWMNAGAMMNRVNFAIALSAGKMPGVQVKPGDAALKLSSPEFQNSLANYPPSSVASPHIFSKVAVEGICGD